MKLSQERLRVRKERWLPAVPGPPSPVLLGNGTDSVPVHVQHRDRERNSFDVETVQKLHVLLGAVGVVAAPPVTKSPPRDDGRWARDGVESPDGGRVVVAVGEHVHIDTTLDPGCNPAVAGEEEALTVVDHRDTIARCDTGLEWDGAVSAVEGPSGATKGGRGGAPTPGGCVVADLATDLNPQTRGAESLPVPGEVQPVGHDLKLLWGLVGVKGRRRQIAINGKRGGTVLEPAVSTPLEPQEAVEKNRDAPVVSLQFRGWWRVRARLGKREARSHFIPSAETVRSSVPGPTGLELRLEPKRRPRARGDTCGMEPALLLVSPSNHTAEDRGFEPLRAINPTRFPSERHRPLGESSAGEATGSLSGREITDAGVCVIRSGCPGDHFV